MKDMEIISRIINKLRIAWMRMRERNLGTLVLNLGVSLLVEERKDMNMKNLDLKSFSNDEWEKILDAKINEIIEKDCGNVCTSCGKEMVPFEFYVSGERVGVQYCMKCWTIFKDESGGGYISKNDRVEVFTFHHVHGKTDSKGIRDILIDDFEEMEGYTDDEEHLEIQKINGEWRHVLY